MLTQELAQLTVCRLQEILADIAKKVEVTNKIGRTGKDLGHRFTDSQAHVMDTGPGRSIACLDLSQELSDVVSILARQLHIGQHELTEAVHAGHKYRGIT